MAWPANWIFSLRHGLPADRYDLMVGKYLFFMQNNLGGVIDVGAEPGLDEALLGRGLGRAGPLRRGRLPRGLAGGRASSPP